MAALSELVNFTSLLKIVSRLPSAIAVTVIVKGKPATAVTGAPMTRVAVGVPQLKSPVHAGASKQSPAATIIGREFIARILFQVCRQAGHLKKSGASTQNPKQPFWSVS